MSNEIPVYEFRPLETGRKLLRYNEGNWIPDDGEYDICFITDDNLDAPFCFYVDLRYRENLQWSWVRNGIWSAVVSNHPNGNAWHYQSKDGTTDVSKRWAGRESHPNYKVSTVGMNKLCEKNGCANGRGVTFEIGDPYILAGLLRERDTKKVVSFPETFNCIYCGSHDLTKIDLSKQKA